MPTVVSLFTGCGGSDAGLTSAGFDIVMANDVLTYAKHVYEANLPITNYIVGDVSDIRTFPKADLLVGCYPCQGFSVGGVRDPCRNVNFLYREFDRALRSIKPKAFIVENVAGMRYGSNIELFKNQIVRFRFAGYRVQWRILNAADFGVPQERARLFFVGLRSDIEANYNFPEPTHNRNDLCISQAISDLPEWPDGEFDQQRFHWYYMSRDRYRGWNQISKTIVANSRHMPLHPSSPSLIKISTDNWRFSDDRPARRLSYKEAARLQGFKRDLFFPDTYGLPFKYKVIGNAVPPPMFREVAKALPNIW